MTRYTATIEHHSISRARVEPVGNTLQAAKRNATRAFGGDFQDYEIVITDTQVSDPRDAAVAWRKVGASRWTSH